MFASQLRIDSTQLFLKSLRFSNVRYDQRIMYWRALGESEDISVRLSEECE